MEVGGIKTWKELKNGVQQLIRLHFNNSLSTPDLSPKNRSLCVAKIVKMIDLMGELEKSSR